MCVCGGGISPQSTGKTPNVSKTKTHWQETNKNTEKRSQRNCSLYFKQLMVMKGAKTKLNKNREILISRGAGVNWNDIPLEGARKSV